MTRLLLATTATLAVAAAVALADDPKAGAPKPSGPPAGSGKILTNQQTYHLSRHRSDYFSGPMVLSRARPTA